GTQGPTQSAAFRESALQLLVQATLSGDSVGGFSVLLVAWVGQTKGSSLTVAPPVIATAPQRALGLIATLPFALLRRGAATIRAWRLRLPAEPSVLRAGRSGRGSRLGWSSCTAATSAWARRRLGPRSLTI